MGGKCLPAAPDSESAPDSDQFSPVTSGVPLVCPSRFRLVTSDVTKRKIKDLLTWMNIPNGDFGKVCTDGEKTLTIPLKCTETKVMSPVDVRSRKYRYSCHESILPSI